jgi:DNA polymerase (family 10)
MINLKLANILLDMAEILKSDLKDKEIPLKLIVTSRTLRDGPELIDRIRAGEKIEELPGIKEPVCPLVAEYLDTGRVLLYEKIRSGYSEEMIRFISVSGLGKKRMFAIYENFNIKSLEELKDGLAETKSFTAFLAKKELFSERDSGFYIKRLRKSLDYMESAEGRFPRWPVEYCLDKIKRELGKMRDIASIAVVGSLRRKKPSVQDIDILVLPYFNDSGYDYARSEELIKDIGSLDFIRRLRGKDQRKESISAVFETDFGIETEFIISSFKDWAVDLLYTTGSKKHIKKLEGLAEGKGYFNGSRIAVDIPVVAVKPGGNARLQNELVDYEQKIYKKFGLQYIPPELREDRGEIEAASKNLLPALVGMKDIKGDLHVHSTWSDGLIDLDDMVERIKKYGYEYLAITDHSESNFYGRGLDKERIKEKTEYVRSLKSKHRNFEILMGSEIDIRKVGRLDYPDDVIRKLDIAIGSLHSSFLNTEAENTARSISAVNNKYIDFIAHPTGKVFKDRAPYFIDIDKLISAVVENRKAMEINSYFLRLDLDEENTKRLKEMGGKVVINTDAHRPNNLDMMRLGVDIARRAGLEKKDVLNTLTLKELRAWKRKRNW